MASTALSDVAAVATVAQQHLHQGLPNIESKLIRTVAVWALGNSSTIELFDATRPERSVPRQGRQVFWIS